MYVNRRIAVVGRGDLWAPNSHPVPFPQTAQDQVPSGLGRGGLGRIPENHGQTIPADYNVFPAMGGLACPPSL